MVRAVPWREQKVHANALPWALMLLEVALPIALLPKVLHVGRTIAGKIDLYNNHGWGDIG